MGQELDHLAGSRSCFCCADGDCPDGEEAGIRFIPIGPDINIEQEAAAIRGKKGNDLIIVKQRKYP